jgi:hypothetical protein
MLVRSENRRISNIRMAKKSFDKVKQIHETLTSDEIKAAEEEYRETRTMTNPKVAYLLRELSAFGYGQHMSNEERLYERRKIHTLPKPWTVPLVMTTVAKMPFAELPGRGKNLFKHHRMEASLEIPIGVPSWLLDDFAGMLQCPGGETLNLTMYRFHFGDSLSLQDWEDQWFHVTCNPHFSLVPYTGEATIDYARMAFVKDYGLQA